MHDNVNLLSELMLSV